MQITKMHTPEEAHEEKQHSYKLGYSYTINNKLLEIQKCKQLGYAWI
jgi:hypothetical protein